LEVTAMDDLAFHGATELADTIRRREISSRELLDHYLARVERINPQLNAIVTLDIDRAQKRAEEADSALARGENWGPLHGVPITVKDTLETAGIRTTAGAPMLSSHVPATDAVSVARLLSAGAVLFGKTNTPIFAGDGQAYNAIFGTTNNPWDLQRSPGGSSGGAAAAISAGLTGLELGSDIGGSIRGPAHVCGVYGLKPTHGTIPLRGHIPGPPGMLSEADIGVVGPIARTSEDLDLALNVLAGPSDDRKIGWRLELPPPRQNSLHEYRVAAWLDDPAFPVDSEMRAVLEGAVDALRRAGVKVNDHARPEIDFARAFRTYSRLLLPIMSSGLSQEQFSALAKIGDSVPNNTSDTATTQAQAITIRHRDWLSMHEERERYRVRWADFFRDYDILLCPPMSVAAIRHDHTEPPDSRTLVVNGVKRPYFDALIAWAGLIGMVYLPSTSSPVGRTAGGLPVGIQIVGPYLEDRSTIDFARRLGEVVGGYQRPPGY
jgi:amidase